MQRLDGEIMRKHKTTMFFVMRSWGKAPSETMLVIPWYAHYPPCDCIHCISFPTSLCGVLVFGSASRPPPPAPVASSHTTCSHTQLTYKHNLLTHNLHTHTQLAHTHNLLTHNLHTHNILTLTHTTCTHTTYSHTTYSHTTCRRGTWRQVAALCVAGVAL